MTIYRYDPREAVRLMNPYRGMVGDAPYGRLVIVLTVAILLVLGVAAAVVTP